MKTPFVDFYNHHNISPVKQDIQDIEKHYNRRESLYHILGIPPILLSSKSILEFGPGSGHNSIYTAKLNPDKYYLIDGSKVGYDALKELFKNKNNIKLYYSLFEEFNLNEKFDLVIAEGCLPHQKEPIRLLKHISSFVNQKGILIITTANGISYLSETLRRLIRDKLNIQNETLENQLNQLRPIYSSHLKTLKNMSRPVDDWILDNIIQPLNTVKLLSIPEVIEALKDEFEFYNSSPSFKEEWRWYKDINTEDKGFNNEALKYYYQRNLNLIDYRFNLEKHTSDIGIEIESLCQTTWNIMCSIENNDMVFTWNDLFENLNLIQSKINLLLPSTALAILEILNWLKIGDIEKPLNNFSQWWGRGSQYVSFIKR
jgi:SAM-dependent methyltransferase